MQALKIYSVAVLAAFVLMIPIVHAQVMVTSLPASAYAQVDQPVDATDGLPAAIPAASEPAMSEEEVGAIVDALGAAIDVGSYAVDKWGESSNTTRAAMLFLMLWIFAPWIVRATPTKWDDKLLAYEGVLGGVRAFLWRVATLRPAKKPDNSNSLS